MNSFKPMRTSNRRQFIAGLPAIGLLAAHAADSQPLQYIVFGSCLDPRYFRSPMNKVAKDKAMLGGTSVPTDDATTTILGEAQWRWLEKVLREPAELRIIVSSIQFAPEAPGGECWANFPHQQQRMLSLLKGRKALVLSGDRHWSEFSRDGVFDFTSSSMTQKHPCGTPTRNKHRVVAKTYHLPNVGHLRLDWASETITAKVIGEDGGVKIESSVPFGELNIA